MPERLPVPGFLLKHNAQDLTGDSSVETIPPAVINNNTYNSVDPPTFDPPPPDEGDLAPADPELGDVYYSFDDEAFFTWDGTEWVELDFQDLGTDPLTGALRYNVANNTLEYWDTVDWIEIDEDSDGLEIALQILPSWINLSRPGGDENQVNIAGDPLTLILTGLQSSDPGGGAVWLFTPP